MKKFFLVLSLCLMTAAPALAHHPMRHHPQPPVFHGSFVPHGHRVHHGGHGVYFFGGLIGAAVGSLVVGSQYQNRTDNNERCFVVVSRSTGNVTKRCVSGSGYDEVVYVD